MCNPNFVRVYSLVPIVHGAIGHARRRPGEQAGLDWQGLLALAADAPDTGLLVVAAGDEGDGVGSATMGPRGRKTGRLPVSTSRFLLASPAISVGRNVADRTGDLCVSRVTE